MNKTLSTFMGLAIIVIIMISLIFGVVFSALKDKSNSQQDQLRNTSQIQMK